MIDDWWYFSAHLSIFSSIFLVIYICSHCVATIARMPHPLWRTARNDAVEVHKKPVKFSYRLQLQEDSVHTTDSVTFHLHLSRSAHIKLFWGVSVSYIFELMNSTWSDFQIAISDSPSHFAAHRAKGYLDTCCHSITDCPVQLSDEMFDGVITVTPPSSLKWTDMKNKYKYPLVIVVYDPNFVDDERMNGSIGGSGSDICGLFTILHVKSDVFPMPTSILSTYIKMDNASTFLLKPLYLVEDDTIFSSDAHINTESPSSGNNNVDERSPSTSGSTDNEELLSPPPVGRLNSKSDSFPNVPCSVCQTYPVSRVILPCGHVALCSECWPKVDKCPICRDSQSVE